MEKKVEDLQKKVDDQEQQDQKEEEQTSDSSGDEPDEDIQNLNTSPSQAPEGVVVVSPDFNAGAATAEEAAGSEAQSYYTQDEWVTANTVLDSAAGEFVVTDAYPDDLGLGVPTYAVTVTIYMADGSSFNRTTYFIYEAGYWAHHLSGEAVDMFDGALY